MAVKNFIFRQNCVGSEVASMKIAFFTIFEVTWSNVFVAEVANIELLK